MSMVPLTNGSGSSSKKEMTRIRLERQNALTTPLVANTMKPAHYTQDSRPRGFHLETRQKRLSIEELNSSFSASDIGYRRKLLLKRHRWTTDVQLALSLFGIAAMVLNIEFLIKGLYEEYSLPAVTLRLMVTVSTVILDIAIVSAWVFSMQLRMLDNRYTDWRMVLTTKDVTILLIELIICSIHPVPRGLMINTSDMSTTGTHKFVSLDAVLSIMMMMRLYIVIKFIAAHSDLRAEGSYQHFSSISKVKINIAFVFKALMSTKPGLVLVSFITVIFFVNSWSLRTCEIFYDSHNSVGGFMNATWLVAMTFLTVGYGDVVPNSYCGRFISAVTAIMGVATTALLVAVLAGMLEQTQTERCVHNFVTRIHLERSRRRAAANVIKISVRLWLLQNSEHGFSSCRLSNRLLDKLNQNVGIMRNCRRQLALLTENSTDISEVGTAVSRLNNVVEKSNVRLRKIERNLLDITSRLDNLAYKIDYALTK